MFWWLGEEGLRRVGSLEFGKLVPWLFGGALGGRGINGSLRARRGPFQISNFILDVV